MSTTRVACLAAGVAVLSAGCLHSAGSIRPKAPTIVKVREVRFSGTKRLSISELDAAVREAVKSSTVAPQDSDARQTLLDRSGAAIEQVAFDRGLVQIKVNRSDLSWAPDGLSVDLIFDLIEGEPSTVQSLDIDPFPPLGLSTDGLRSLLTTRPGNIFSRSAIRDDVATLSQLCRSNGYPSAVVTPLAHLDTSTHSISLTLSVELGPAEPEIPPRKPGVSVRVPFFSLIDLAIVDVFLDGRGPFPFLLDTGAAVTVVSPTLARDLHLRPSIDEKRQLVDSAGIAFSSDGKVSIDELRIGGRRFASVSASVVDLSFTDRTMHRPLAGVLGLELFRDLVVALDYPTSTLELIDGDLAPPDSERIFPLVRSLQGLLLVDMVIGTKHVAATLDSGDEGFMSLAREDWANHRWSTAPLTVGKVIAASGHIDDNRVARLDEDATLGRYVFTHPIVAETSGDTRVGAKLLKNFRVSIDIARRRIRFDRATNEPIASPTIATIGVGVIWNEHGATIAYVLDAAPDAKRIRPGDHLISIEGRSALTLDAVVIEALLETKPRVHVVLERDGAMIDLDLSVLHLPALAESGSGR